VGPFVGTLLADRFGRRVRLWLEWWPSRQTGSAVLLLALFPSYLSRLPKSGQWMARIKIVLGFVILAAMLKYVSNIDAVMQWSILTRERFWQPG